MKEYTIHLVNSNLDLIYNEDKRLEFVPDYMYHDDMVYQYHSRLGDRLMYVQSGNCDVIN